MIRLEKEVVEPGITCKAARAKAPHKVLAPFFPSRAFLAPCALLRCAIILPCFGPRDLMFITIKKPYGQPLQKS